MTLQPSFHMTVLDTLRRRKRFTNREGHADFDFTLERSRARPGVSAMVRVRNEAPKLGYCLRSILPIFDEIVVIDNGSDDGSTDIVRDVMRESGTDAIIHLRTYPHRVSRFGPEHNATPEDSVHSLAYFTNWSLSQCSYRYVCKWDGDMVAVRAVRPAFISFLREIQSRRETYYNLSGQTIYRNHVGEYYLAVGEVNTEVEVFPYSFRCRFRKRQHWEGLTRPTTIRKADFAPVSFYELKFTDEDEFDHWSTTEFPSDRKQREWLNFHAVKDGDPDPERFQRLSRTFLDDQLT